VKRRLFNENERFTYAKANAMGKTGQQYLDEILSRLLVSAADSLPLAEGETAYFPPSDCLVSHVGGDRSTGVTFSVAAGLGFKNVGSGETDADEPKIQPIHVSAAFQFVTDNSDPTNPRIDRLFMKPKRTDGTSTSVDVINPSTKAITPTSLNTYTVSNYDFAYVAGTPAASPVAPSPPAGYVAADAVCEILMAPGSGSFTPAGNLTDLRDTLELGNGIAPGFTGAAASTITVASPLSDGDVQAALERHDTEIVASVPTGLLIGRLEYVNTQSVKIARGLGGEIRVELDGVVVVRSASDLTWDFATDLDTGSETASTWYYLYVFESGGALVPKISATGPVMDAASGKVGYHPTNTTWRCIGSFYNNASSNIMPFDRHSDGWVVYRAATAGTPFTEDLGNPDTQTTYTTKSLSGAIPATARAVRLQVRLAEDDAITHYGHESLSGLTVSSNKSVNKLNAQTANNHGSDTAQFDIAVDSTPSFAWGIEAAGGNYQAHESVVVGYREPLFLGGC